MAFDAKNFVAPNPQGGFDVVINGQKQYSGIDQASAERNYNTLTAKPAAVTQAFPTDTTGTNKTIAGGENNVHYSPTDNFTTDGSQQKSLATMATILKNLGWTGDTSNGAAVAQAYADTSKQPVADASGHVYIAGSTGPGSPGTPSASSTGGPDASSLGGSQLYLHPDVMAQITAASQAAATQAYLNRKLALIDIPLSQVEKDRIALQAATTAAQNVIQQNAQALQAAMSAGQLGQAYNQTAASAAAALGQLNLGQNQLAATSANDLATQQNVQNQQALSAATEAGTLGLGVGNLEAQLRGPRNAFAQQAVMNGLNSNGLSNALGAISGTLRLPGFQAPQAAGQPATLTTMQQDQAAAGGTPTGQTLMDRLLSQAAGHAPTTVDTSNLQKYAGGQFNYRTPAALSSYANGVLPNNIPTELQKMMGGTMPFAVPDVKTPAYSATGPPTYDPTNGQFTLPKMATGGTTLGPAIAGEAGAEEINPTMVNGRPAIDVTPLGGPRGDGLLNRTTNNTSPTNTFTAPAAGAQPTTMPYPGAPATIGTQPGGTNSSAPASGTHDFWAAAGQAGPNYTTPVAKEPGAMPYPGAGVAPPSTASPIGAAVAAQTNPPATAPTPQGTPTNPIHVTQAPPTAAPVPTGFQTPPPGTGAYQPLDPTQAKGLFDYTTAQYHQMQAAGQPFTAQAFGNILQNFGLPPSVAQRAWDLDQQYQAQHGTSGDAGTFQALVNQAMNEAGYFSGPQAQAPSGYGPTNTFTVPPAAQPSIPPASQVTAAQWAQLSPNTQAFLQSYWASNSQGSPATGTTSTLPPDTAPYGTVPTQSLIDAYIKALPPYNKIDVQQFQQLSPDTQQLMLGGYEKRGDISGTDLEALIKNQLSPQFKAPTFGLSA